MKAVAILKREGLSVFLRSVFRPCHSSPLFPFCKQKREYRVARALCVVAPPTHPLFVFFFFQKSLFARTKPKPKTNNTFFSPHTQPIVIVTGSPPGPTPLIVVVVGWVSGTPSAGAPRAPGGWMRLPPPPLDDDATG